MRPNPKGAVISLPASSIQIRSKLEKCSKRSSAIVQAATTEVSVDWNKVGEELNDKSPLEIMDHALATFGDGIAIAFSGAEDVALIEYAHLTGRPYRVFSLDTGRLNPETYRLFDAVEKRYGIRIEYTFPESQEVLDLVRTKGMFSFYEDGHQECCRVRKVRPLRRQLATLTGWITGQRKDQSPGTRTEIPVVQVDPVFEGSTGGAGSLIKYNPLASVTSAEVWNFLRVMNVPVNEMHANGYISIGCEPCTRPVLPNQHEREGRWWWEDATKKECGLHAGNVAPKEGEAALETEGDATTVDSTERAFDRDLWNESSAVVNLSKDDVSKLLAGNRDKATLVVLYAPWCPFCQAMEASYEEIASTFNDIQVARMRADTERDFAKSEFGLTSFPTIALLPKGSAKPVKFPSERRDPRTLGMWLRVTA